jgi:hypothetical protein
MRLTFCLLLILSGCSRSQIRSAPWTGQALLDGLPGCYQIKTTGITGYKLPAMLDVSPYDPRAAGDSGVRTDIHRYSIAFEATESPDTATIRFWYPTHSITFYVAGDQAGFRGRAIEWWDLGPRTEEGLVEAKRINCDALTPDVAT